MLKDIKPISDEDLSVVSVTAQAEIEEEPPFVCRRCGNCCRGEGFVWLSDDDIERISGRLRITRKEFVAQYTCRLTDFGGGIVLINKDDKAISCIFLEAYGCSVHEVKPGQCAGFPMTWSRDDAMAICAGLQAIRRAVKTKP
jgi:uncharacterized protein